MLWGCTGIGRQRQGWTASIELAQREIGKKAGPRPTPKAKCRATVNYSELRPDAPKTLAVPLDEINRHEHREGRPLLSAVVTHKDGDQMSGDGFFRIAWELGEYQEGDPERYWRQELKRVWDYWQTR